jgi:protein DJ-1
MRDRPGTAMLFSLTIVELLCGKEKRNEVEGPMVTAEML